MEHLIEGFVQWLPWPMLFLFIAACLAVLGKAADWLVKEAVALSERSGIPKIVIGATVVSLGTTTPEAAVSVFAALYGDASLALGNAVGSIICDSGLILGVACLISPLPLHPNIVNRQGWLQLLAGMLLVAGSFPWGDPSAALDPARGGNLPQFVGWIFLGMLVGYLWLSTHWARQELISVELEEFEGDVNAPVAFILGRLIFAIGVVLIASHVLIPSVNEAAVRMQIPQEVIAASLVAFGTSLPELVTAVTAARRGHGDLAVGNVVGADILNVLFVAGAAAAVTPDGLDASPHFFRILFPGMIFLLVVFRIGIMVSRDKLQRPFGFVLLAAYLVISVLNYVLVPTTLLH